MFIHWKTITATHTGQRIESVTCEQCGTRYHYELTRAGVGVARALYGLGSTSAALRAHKLAETNLARRLATEAELVPCPSCQWVNRDLVDRYRNRLYRRAPLLIGIIIIVGFFALPLLMALLVNVLGYNSHIPRYAGLGILAAVLTCPVWVLGIRALLRGRINPNANFPNPPTLPPATPPPILEQVDHVTGTTSYVPIARDDQATPRSAIFRSGQLVFPKVCCACLGPADTIYRVPMQANKRSDFQLPMCKPCLSALRRKWWSIVFGACLLFLVIGAVTIWYLPSIDESVRWCIFGLVSLFGTLLFGTVIAGMLTRPYRVSTIDRDRGIFKLVAENTNYTGQLAQQIRLSEHTVRIAGPPPIPPSVPA